MILSIIIPVYNVENYIEKCLNSVINQKENDNVEIIIVDDCGTDNSMKIVYNIIKEQSYLCEFRIIYHTHNQGLSAARNTGVQHAKGEYIFFLDSDDELPTNTINIFKYNIKLHKDIDFFIGNYNVIGNFKKSNLNSHKNIYKNNEYIYKSYTNGEWYPMAWGKLIKRSFFIANDLWFPINRYHEDLYFSFKLALCANKAKVISDNIYIYRIRKSSITTSKKRKNYIDIFWILSQQKKLLYKKETKMSSLSYNYIASLSCNLLLSTYISQLNEKEKFIIATWIKKELKDVKKIYSIKSFIKTSIIYTPHMFLLILSYFYKILK